MPRVAAYQGREPPDPQAALAEVERIARAAEAQGAQILCLPECWLTGYFSDADVARPHAIALDSASFARVLARLAELRPVLVLGLVESSGAELFITAAVIRRGRLLGSYRKQRIHERGFTAGERSPVFDVAGTRIGVNICSDANDPDAAARLAAAGARVILYPLNNLLPREVAESWRHRHVENLIARARETGCWVVSADVVGSAQDSIGYGCTAVVDPRGVVRARCPELEEGLLIHDVEVGPSASVAR